MPAGRPKKSVYDKLKDVDMEFVYEVQDMGREEIKLRAAQVAFNESENRRAEKADEDLAAKKEAVKDASLQYRTSTKANTLRISYLKELLDSKGG